MPPAPVSTHHESFERQRVCLVGKRGNLLKKCRGVLAFLGLADCGFQRAKMIITRAASSIRFSPSAAPRPRASCAVWPCMRVKIAGQAVIRWATTYLAFLLLFLLKLAPFYLQLHFHFARADLTPEEEEAWFKKHNLDGKAVGTKSLKDLNMTDEEIRVILQDHIYSRFIGKDFTNINGQEKLFLWQENEFCEEWGFGMEEYNEILQHVYTVDFEASERKQQCTAAYEKYHQQVELDTITAGGNARKDNVDDAKEHKQLQENNVITVQYLVYDGQRPPGLGDRLLHLLDAATVALTLESSAAFQANMRKAWKERVLLAVQEEASSSSTTNLGEYEQKSNGTNASLSSRASLHSGESPEGVPFDERLHQSGDDDPSAIKMHFRVQVLTYWDESSIHSGLKRDSFFHVFKKELPKNIVFLRDEKHMWEVLDDEGPNSRSRFFGRFRDYLGDSKLVARSNVANDWRTEYMPKERWFQIKKQEFLYELGERFGRPVESMSDEELMVRLSLPPPSELGKMYAGMTAGGNEIGIEKIINADGDAALEQVQGIKEEVSSQELSGRDEKSFPSKGAMHEPEQTTASKYSATPNTRAIPLLLDLMPQIDLWSPPQHGSHPEKRFWEWRRTEWGRLYFGNDYLCFLERFMFFASKMQMDVTAFFTTSSTSTDGRSELGSPAANPHEEQENTTSPLQTRSEARATSAARVASNKKASSPYFALHVRVGDLQHTNDHDLWLRAEVFKQLTEIAQSQKKAVSSHLAKIPWVLVGDSEQHLLAYQRFLAQKLNVTVLTPTTLGQSLFGEANYQSARPHLQQSGDYATLYDSYVLSQAAAIIATTRRSDGWTAFAALSAFLNWDRERYKYPVPILSLHRLHMDRDRYRYAQYERANCRVGPVAVNVFHFPEQELFWRVVYQRLRGTEEVTLRAKRGAWFHREAYSEEYAPA
ncbi:unnamed protein product [Amoebophrya sp. A120]|nr:unnamed protein product [Amoebophrya sp. A120]|eukprot:GSA120T00018824001.1